jgi:hypothetical protein
MGRRGQMGPALGIAVCLLALALLLYLTAIPQYRDGCEQRGREGSPGVASDPSIWPPGTNCTFMALSGETSEYFEGPGDWVKWTQLGLVVSALAVGGAGLMAGIRDTRRPA